MSGICAEIEAAGANAVVVDNSESESVAAFRSQGNCHAIAVGDNVGIARAQNIGIEWALGQGADAIMFLDQDSSIDCGFVTTLAARLERDVYRVVAPVCIDEATGVELPAVRLGKFGRPKSVYAHCTGEAQQANVVISSGTMVSRQVLERVGGMDERFYIDFVDTEWCLRCRAKGVPIALEPGAVLRHTIGLHSIRAGMFTILVHTPTRCYYQLRNGFLLLRTKHVPLVFALREMAGVLASRLLLLVLTKDRRAYAKAFVAGVWDGLRGTNGRRKS